MKKREIERDVTDGICLCVSRAACFCHIPLCFSLFVQPKKRRKEGNMKERRTKQQLPRERNGNGGMLLSGMSVCCREEREEEVSFIAPRPSLYTARLLPVFVCEQLSQDQEKWEAD